MHHSLIIRSSGNNFCSKVLYSIVLDSVFCLLCAVSVKGFVGPTKPCTDTAHDKQKTESRTIEYDTWLQKLFPELLMMSE